MLYRENRIAPPDAPQETVHVLVGRFRVWQPYLLAARPMRQSGNPDSEVSVTRARSFWIRFIQDPDALAKE
jgi:hypothetical protein